jgi:hypothetical protein
MQKWEYQTITKDVPRGAEQYYASLALVDENNLGNEGWELVSVQYAVVSKDIAALLYFFKRPLE